MRTVHQPKRTPSASAAGACQGLRCIAAKRTAVALGVLFGWWTVRTGSLLPALLGHALANGFALLVVAALRSATLPGHGVPAAQAVVWQPWWYYALGALLLAGGVATTRHLLSRLHLRELEPLPAPAAAESDGDEERPSRPVPGRAPGSWPGAAAGRVLSPLWWTVGGLAYASVAGLVILVATSLTGQPFGPWPTAGAYALLALAGTALLHRTHALTLAVRVIAPVVLVLLVLLSALFRPPETRARRTAAAGQYGGARSVSVPPAAAAVRRARASGGLNSAERSTSSTSTTGAMTRTASVSACVRWRRAVPARARRV